MQVVIVGAGHAAGQLVASLRQRGFAGSLVLIGDEPWLPYQRPPLSKKYLAGKLPAERLFLKPQAFYETAGVKLHLDRRVVSIDRDAGSIETDDGRSIAWDRLVLATGASPRRLAVPGTELPGVHYLRSIGDVDGIRGELAGTRRVAIVGGGYIGLEVAAVARQAGHAVTVVELEDRVMSRVVAPPVSEFFAAKHRAAGVDLQLSTGVTAFAGDDRLRRVVTASGDDIEADCAVIGIGIAPNDGLAAAAGLATDDGIVVDEYCRSSDPRIFAIGDCTRHPSRIYRRSLRLESVHNALEQAKTAAANLLGEEQRYDDVPWFWSDQYDVKLQIAGVADGYEETMLRGDPDAGGFACAYLRDGRLIAVDAVNRARDFVQAKALIANGGRIDRERLADAAVAMKDCAAS